MANKIVLKKSSVASKVPTTSDLDYGELALNYADGKLYFKSSTNEIQAFAAGGASGVVDTFKNIAVAGQDTIVADTSTDTLTLAAGTGVTITTDSTTDTITLTNAGVTSVNGVTGAITATNLLDAVKTVDGASSGLDADTLDGNHASAFYLATNPNGYTTNTGTVTSITAGSYLTGGTITTSGTLAVDATSANTASKVVARDASGNFSANIITASLSGNASTVTDGVYTTGSYADPAWITSLAKSKVGLGNVENTALSTWAGSSNITTIGAATAASLTVTGDLVVNGTTTTINSTTISVDDKNIELGAVATPSNTTADGGGITLKGATDKTFNWVNATGAWTSSEDLNLASGKVYEINGTTVLSASTLGSGVTSSSLTSVGTITTGTWSASFGAVSGANLTNLTAGNLTGTIPSAVLGNSSTFIGTTSVALNRASANLALTGISSIALPGSTSGTVTLQPAAAAGTTTITLPATTGTVVTTGDSGTVTSTMIADGTIVNGDISASAAIAISKLAASTISGISLGNNLTTLTLNVSGTGLSGSTTYNGSAAATFTVTSNATNANTASTIVARDASGNFTAGTITAALSGNATTATTLQTARNINGTSFNGSADITTANWGTARTITIGSTGKSVNGSANVSWSLAEIGAQPAGSYLTAESDTLATVTARGNTATAGNLGLTAGEGYGFTFWGNGDNYKISMGVTAGTYQYGPVTDYSIKMQMDAGSPGRGFTWGVNGGKPVAALNATSGNMQIAGSFYAASKSFLIDHPTQSGKKLVHGSLEGPEHGVYVRGKLKGKVIELPEYWTKLVDPDSITVQLTPIGKHQKLYVEDIRDNKVYVANEGLFAPEPNCFYTVFAERVDIEKLQVEVE